MGSDAGTDSWFGPAVTVVSPHLDDGVLSCGHLLAACPGSRVVTVFSGGPKRVWRLPAWDRASGVFSPGADVMGVRRHEDDEALAVLGAGPERLGFWDSQYRSRARRRGMVVGEELLQAVADRLLALVRTSTTIRWFVPLGLVHEDHELTAEACRRVAGSLGPTEPMGTVGAVQWVGYEDQPYAAERPELVADVLARLDGAGWSTEPVSTGTTTDTGRKQAALERYRSQWQALGERRLVAVQSPEAYHRLLPPTDGNGR